jgi:hypothetical protein
MVDWKKLADKASDVVQKRGGTKSLEEDAAELADIAKGGGTLSDKAKQAATALKEPGAHAQPAAETPDEQG